ncbi:MAG: glycosyltransferase family 39 protein [Gemmatimonadaceae bacterium]
MIDERRLWRAAIGVTAIAAVGRAILASLVPLFPDETYYWEWSRHLAAGYFDHPPAIALLVRFGTVLLGDTPLGVRLGALVAGTVAMLACLTIARRLAGDRAAFIAALILTCLPLAAAGLVLATPDAPLLCAAALGVAAIERALDAPARSTHATRWWGAAGLCLGAAFSSKFTAILLPAGVVVGLLLRPSLRRRFAEPGPWVACAVAILVFSPVLVWNARHDWIAFRFQLQHGLGTPSGSAWNRELQMVAGQAGLASPILFVLLVIAVGRHLRRSASDGTFVLAFMAAFTFLFFAYSATRRSVEANWPAPSLIPAIPLLASVGVVASSRWRRWLQVGLIAGGALVALVYVQALVPILPIAARRDPIARAAGWNLLAASVASARARAATGASPRRHVWIAADRYQDASEIAFHIADHPPVSALNLAGRPNQYALWPRFADQAKAGDALVVATDEGADPPVIRALRPHFVLATAFADVALTRGGRVAATRRVWILDDWRATWPAAADLPSR